MIFAHFWDQITMEIQFPGQNVMLVNFWDQVTNDMKYLGVN